MASYQKTGEPLVSYEKQLMSSSHECVKDNFSKRQQKQFERCFLLENEKCWWWVGGCWLDKRNKRAVR
jgi:hypothetical protein